MKIPKYLVYVLIFCITATAATLVSASVRMTCSDKLALESLHNGNWRFDFKSGLRCSTPYEHGSFNIFFYAVDDDGIGIKTYWLYFRDFSGDFFSTDGHYDAPCWKGTRLYYVAIQSRNKADMSFNNDKTILIGKKLECDGF